MQEQFEMEFDRLKVNVPTFSTPTFAELVKAAIEAEMLPVHEPKRYNQDRTSSVRSMRCIAGKSCKETRTWGSRRVL